MSECLSQEDLSRYAVGNLADKEVQAVETHLEQCPRCLSLLDTLQHRPDTLLSALRRPALAIPANSSELAIAVAAAISNNRHSAGILSLDLTVGTVIGGYRIVELLGHGGMGRVYRARHPRLDQDVALKVLRPGFDSSPFVARFEAERQALALMDHPHIARVFDGGVTNQGQPYFVMELVCGTTITRYCQEQGLPLTHCLELFVEVCQAVQHAHQKGIIHRDLKPSNILVAEYDGQPIPKIIDFGVAKAVEGRATADTEIGTLIGTLEYMSPEQANLSARDLDTRSDIYALGVLLYELLTGAPPLSRGRIRELPMLEILRLIREEDPPPPSVSLVATAVTTDTTSGLAHELRKLAKQIRGELDWIALKALDKDRSQRYESVSALAEDVHRFLNDELVLAGPRNRAYRLRKFLRRNRRAVGTATGFVLLLIFSAITSTWLALESREARAKAEIDRDHAEAVGKQAKESAAEARSVLKFFQERVMAVGRPDGQEGGLGRDVTIRQAVDSAEPRIAEAFEGQPLIEAAVRQTLGSTYIYVGEPAAAVRQLERAWELRRDQHGLDHVETLDSLHALGIACQHAGELERAVSSLEQAWHRREAGLGADHQDTLKSMNELAASYRAVGKIDEALKLATDAVARSSATLGADHHDTLVCQIGLASTQQAAGKIRIAVDLFEKSVEGMTVHVGGEHPDTLAAMNSLGLAYIANGQFDEAITLFEKAQEAQIRKLGPDHLHVLTTMSNLAFARIEKGQADQAVPLLQTVLAGRTVKLSFDHPSTLMSMNSLASAYQLTGQPTLAFPLLERVFEISRSRLGADHPDTLNAMNNYAALHYFAGKVDQAIALHEEALERRTAKLGLEHMDTLVSMNNLAYCYWTAKKNDLSIDLFQKTLKGRTAVVGPDHPQTLNVLITLSAVYRDTGQPDQAIQLIEQALSDRQVRLGADHSDSKRLAGQLASLRFFRGSEYLAQQDFAAAEVQFRLALKNYDEQPNTWSCFATCSGLGGALLGQQRFAEAEPMLLRAHEGMKLLEAATPAVTNKSRTEVIERLIRLYDALGNTEEAAEWREIGLLSPD